MTSAYLKGVQTAHPHARSCSYLGVRLRPSCSDAGKSQARTVDDVVTNPQPLVLLSSSQGHDYVCINVMLTRVVIFPVLLLTGLSVLSDAPAEARVVVCLRPVAHAVGHIGRRLALVCMHKASKSDHSWPGYVFSCKKSRMKISVMKQV
jgi:hypothetical protein